MISEENLRVPRLGQMDTFQRAATPDQSTQVEKNKVVWGGNLKDAHNDFNSSFPGHKGTI